MPEPHHTTTLSISAAGEGGSTTSTTSTTLNRVDWRNYDYSEGPPKVKPVAVTRDVNPYSKRVDLQPSRSSLSRSGYSTTNTGSLPSEDFHRNHSYSGSTSSHTLQSKSHLLSSSFDESYLGKKSNSTNTAFVSPSATMDEPEPCGISLKYRPAKANITPPTDIEEDDDYDEEEEMRIPKVKKYGENLTSPTKNKHHLPLDGTDERNHYDALDEADEQIYDEPYQSPLAIGYHEERNCGFEDAWEDAEKEEQHFNEHDYNEDDDDEIEIGFQGKIQFDDFAGDRSKASSIHEKQSDASVSRMEVPLNENIVPVSILKHSGRFDPSVMSNNSSQPTYTEEIDQPESDDNGNEKVSEEVEEQDNENQDKDDDTLFKFSSKAPKKKRKGRSRTGRSDSSEEDDDTSIENDAPKNRADSLKDRTKQAWSARNKATAAALAKGDVTINNSRKEKVSFHNDATVREFEPENNQSENEEDESVEESDDATEYTEGTYYDDDTYAGRSMHSIYTKSAESETEDFIKDIFLIGRGEATNPGRRQLRYKKGRKELYSQMQKNENTTNTIDDDILDMSTESAQESKYSFGLLSNLCEDTFQAISDVLGFSRKYVNDNDDSTVGSQMTATTANEWFKNVSRVAFYADEVVDNQNGLCGPISAKKKNDHSSNNSEALMQMSLNAARFKHSSRKFKYDETQSINVLTDIKVVKLSVGIPIGIGFDENELGCVVKRIFENGNTANASRGDKIEVGDHLASINGANVYKKSVTDICNILAACANTEEIQFIFLRYIGPIRNSNAAEQQGYEVIDPKIGKRSTSPLKLSKSLSNISSGKVQPNLVSRKHSTMRMELTEKKETQNEIIINEETKGIKMKRLLSFRKGTKKGESKTDGATEENKNQTRKKRGFGFFRNRRGVKKKESK